MQASEVSRATRVEFDGACYHVMSRGVARRKTFMDGADHQAFLDGVCEVVESGGLLVHAFCLMPNHHHMLVTTPHGELGRWMRHVNGDYARRFNARHKRVGHLWQGRYKAILVEGDGYLVECARYIHLNPNRAQLTRPAERYRWSSYRNYVGGPAVASWVDTSAVMSRFDDDPAAYRAHVEDGRGERPVSPFDRAVAGLALGSAAFVARVTRIVDGRPDNPDEPMLRGLRRQSMAEPELVERALADIFGDEPPARRGRLRLYTLRRHSRLRPSEVARHCGRSPSAVTRATQAIEAEALENERLAGQLAELARRLRR